jgi:hypothetical protein
MLIQLSTENWSYCLWFFYSTATKASNWILIRIVVRSKTAKIVSRSSMKFIHDFSFHIAFVFYRFLLGCFESEWKRVNISESIGWTRGEKVSQQHVTTRYSLYLHGLSARCKAWKLTKVNDIKSEQQRGEWKFTAFVVDPETTFFCWKLSFIS